MRRALKFCHVMGAVGLLGAMACLLVLISVLPPKASLVGSSLAGSSLAGYAAIRGAMG